MKVPSCPSRNRAGRCVICDLDIATSIEILDSALDAVKTADNGKDALAKLRERDSQIDLVLSDVYMPGENFNSKSLGLIGMSSLVGFAASQTLEGPSWAPLSGWETPF